MIGRGPFPWRSTNAATAADIATPVMSFRCARKTGGVLVRAGHTEAAVDISRLAGLNASGVICEVMNDDGSMARLPDLVAIAQRHGMNGSARSATFIAYRRPQRQSRPNAASEADGGKRVRRGVDAENLRRRDPGAEHIALVKGDITGETPLLVAVCTPSTRCSTSSGWDRRAGRGSFPTRCGSSPTRAGVSSCSCAT